MGLIEQEGPGGSRTTDVVTESFGCVVTTARTGLFIPGLSTVIWTPKKRPVMEIRYLKECSREERQQCHSRISEALEAAGGSGESLESAIATAYASLAGKQENVKRMTDLMSRSLHEPAKHGRFVV